MTRRDVIRRRLAARARQERPPTRRRRWLVVDNGIQVRLFLTRPGDRGWVSRTLTRAADIGPVSDHLVRRRAELDRRTP